MKNAIVHEVADGFDNNGKQRCILCGAIVEDNGATLIRPMGAPMPKARSWAAGSVTERKVGVGITEWVAGAQPGAAPCVALEPQ